MNKVVLDSSALLAILNQEPGYEQLTSQVLSVAIIGAVNLAEAQTKLVAQGFSPDEAWEAVLSPVSEIADFTPEHAKIVGSLVTITRSLGLSLGDRACLALALTLNAAVYTADKSWKNLKLGIPIHLIR
jgi:ribonuclease VapC